VVTETLSPDEAAEFGTTALLAASSRFESDALRIERQTQVQNGQDRLRAALARQEALWMHMRRGTAPIATSFGIGESNG
jgi:hypothetical protein